MAILSVIRRWHRIEAAPSVARSYLRPPRHLPFLVTGRDDVQLGDVAGLHPFARQLVAATEMDLFGMTIMAPECCGPRVSDHPGRATRSTRQANPERSRAW